MPGLAEMPDMPPVVRSVKSGTGLALMTVNTRLACVIPARGLPIPQHKLRRRVTSRVKSVTPAARLSINGRKTLARASRLATAAGRPARRPAGAARSRNLTPVRSQCKDYNDPNYEFTCDDEDYIDNHLDQFESAPYLYSDGTVSTQLLSGKTPIAIVISQEERLAIALKRKVSAWFGAKRIYGMEEFG